MMEEVDEESKDTPAPGNWHRFVHPVHPNGMPCVFDRFVLMKYTGFGYEVRGLRRGEPDGLTTTRVTYLLVTTSLWAALAALDASDVHDS